MKTMKLYEGKFFRSNPQIQGNGYETTRTIEANTLKSAEKKLLKKYSECLYGGMTLLYVKEC